MQAPQVTDISTPGMSSTPNLLAADAASRSPEVLSWSVSAIMSTPAAAARPTSSPGARDPSEAEEWVWRSGCADILLFYPIPGQTTALRTARIAAL